MSDDVRQSETGFELGEDLYGVSVAQLKARVGLLQAEIARIEAELVKKENDISAAHQLFNN